MFFLGWSIDGVNDRLIGHLFKVLKRFCNARYPLSNLSASNLRRCYFSFFGALSLNSGMFFFSTRTSLAMTHGTSTLGVLMKRTKEITGVSCGKINMQFFCMLKNAIFKYSLYLLGEKRGPLDNAHGEMMTTWLCRG